MDGPIVRVAENLRRLRQSQRLSLSELARRSGLTKGTLSRLEAGEGNPTVETLWALAGALEVPWGELIAGGKEEPAVVRAGEGAVVPGANGAARLVRGWSSGPASFEWYELVLHADSAPSVAHAGGVREHVWVVEGRAEVGPLHAPQRLGVGDYLTFLADVPHVYRPLDGPSARLVLLIHYPPLTGAARLHDLAQSAP